MPYRHIDKSTKLMLLRMRGKCRSIELEELTGISRRTIQRVVQLYNKTGRVVRPCAISGRPRKLSSLAVSFLEGCVWRQPDILLRELQELLVRVCGIFVSIPTLLRSLARRGLTYKKVTRVAGERDETDRARFRWLVGTFYRASQFVSVDESACDRRTSRRRYAWSYAGTRALVRDSFARGGKYSILPAISLSGVLHCVIHEGSINGERFKDFIEGLLQVMNPFPGDNSVILMDNASIHKSLELREMVERCGMRILFVPAYSPDMNPIEHAFSAIKAWLRSHQQEALHMLSGHPGADPVGFLLTAVFSVTREQIYKWYKYSNYVM